MPTNEITRPGPDKIQKKPVPKPEGDRKKADPGDFDPFRRKDYKDHDGDAADPQRIGPGT